MNAQLKTISIYSVLVLVISFPFPKILMKFEKQQMFVFLSYVQSSFEH